MPPIASTCAIVLLAAALASCATPVPVARSCFHADAQEETDIGYCQAVRVGNTLNIAGTTGRGDMPSAIRTAYDRLGATLKAHGLDFGDVVSERVYATNLDEFIAHKHLRKAYYGETFPAATWVQVDRLYVPSLVVEVELVAVFPE